jgi:hypothetical protein
MQCNTYSLGEVLMGFNPTNKITPIGKILKNMHTIHENPTYIIQKNTVANLNYTNYLGINYSRV